MSALEAEARAWLMGTKKGPKDRDHFVIFRDGTGWTLLSKPLEGRDTIATGLSYPEVNRLRLALSDEGFIGKVLE